MAPLLEEVVAEHGPSVAIADVNRIRSGGIGGFFCREEFEVVVDLEDDEGPGAGRRSDTDPGSDPHPRPDIDLGAASDRVDQAETTDGVDAVFAAALERRLDEAADTEASMVRETTGRGRRKRKRAKAPGAAASASASTPTPNPTPTPTPNLIPAPNPTPAPADHPIPLAATMEPLDDESGEAPGPPVEPLPAPDPGLAPEPVPTIEPVASGAAPIVEIAAEPAVPAFWSRLSSTESELHGFVPEAASLTAVIGPLASAVPIVRHLQCRHRLDPTDVVVLTPRAEIVSEPSWPLVRSSRDLIEAAASAEGAPRLLVIDVPPELPSWVAPLLDGLRSEGVDLVRYVVPGLPAPDDLLGYWAGPDEPYVVDLVARIEPDRLIRLVDHGHPVATVACVELTAALLVAMRGAAGA